MKNVVEYKTARTTEYALLTQPIINDNRNRREEKPEVQMGGAGPAVGRLSPEPGRPSGLQRGASAHPRGPGPERCGHRLHRHGLQPFLRRAGAHRGTGGRPFQPEMDRHGKYPVLERGHDVHGPLQRVRDARADAQRRHGRRRGIFRTGQLFAAGAVPRQDAGLRHVGPPDGLLHRHHHQRLCRGLYWTAVGLAQRLLRLRRRRRRARRHHGRAAEGQEGAGCRRP